MPINSSCIPENIRRLMHTETRKALGKGAMTMPEINEKQEIRLERELHKLIWNELHRREIVAIHSRTDRKATIGIGIPDFCFVIKGYPIAVEVKMPNAKLTKEQDVTMRRMGDNGWAYYVVRSFENFLEVLEPYTSLSL